MNNEPKLFEHIKTGNLYVVLTDNAINATNGDTDGYRMVVYMPKDNVTKIYTREYGQFMARFREYI